MSKNARIDDPTSPAEGPVTPRWWPAGVALGSILLAFLAGSMAYVDRVLTADHYQFALMVPFAAAYLIWHWQTPRPTEVRASKAVVALLAIAALLLFDAILVHASVSWVLGFIIASLAIILAAGGWSLFKQIWPAWAVLWLMVPPPFGLDYRLITSLQLWVSKTASVVLDAVFQVPHVLHGNVIQLRDQDLFVAEACSGINSLFATGAVLVFAMFFFKRRRLHIALLYALGFVAVMAVNVLRVTSLTWMHWRIPNVGAFFSEGIPHTALGLGFFAILLALLISCDALLFLLGNWVALVLPQGIGRTWQPELDRTAEPRSKEIEPAKLEVAGTPMRWIMLALPFSMLLVFQFTVLLRPAEEVSVYGGEDPIPSLIGDARQTLPESWEGWRLTKYHEAATPFANSMQSSIWTYTSTDGLQATLFLHRPYHEWHPMHVCYAGNGWEVSDVPADQLKLDAGQSMQTLSFRINKKSQHRFVTYTFFDLNRRDWLESVGAKPVLTVLDQIQHSMGRRAQALVNAQPEDEILSAGLILEVDSAGKSFTSAEYEDASKLLQMAAQRLFGPLERTQQGGRTSGLKPKT